MVESIINNINLSTIIAMVALGIAIFSLVYPWTKAKPHLVIASTSRTGSPMRTTILVQNIGEAVAHRLVIYARFPEKTKITFLDKGIFKIVEGGIGKDSVKLQRDQVAPGVSLPYVLLTGEQNGIFPEPTIYAESREMARIPIQLMKEPGS